MDGVKIKIIDEKSPYLEKVIKLGDSNQKTLGFFRKPLFLEQARKKLIIIAIDSKSQLLGYLMYGISQKNRYVKLIHLCVDKQYRGKKITRKLVEYLRNRTKDYLGISLSCRRDYQIDPMWISLGFVYQGEKPAKTPGKILTTWWLDYGHPNLLSIIPQQLSESSLCVIIDLPIFEELCLSQEQNNSEVRSSLADWLESEITLCITDEIYNNINYIENDLQREKFYTLVSNFTQLSYNNFERIYSILTNCYVEERLETEKLVLRHLAKAIGSESQIFITQNDNLLSPRDRIYDRFQLSIKTPTELISQLDELSNKPQYQPVRLAGTQLNIIRIGIDKEKELVERFRDRDRNVRIFSKDTSFYNTKAIALIVGQFAIITSLLLYMFMVDIVTMS